ncbi:MAG: hypothetical protein JWR50_722 [Mucilaginibacter sp.]|nr:hypothetical protein [Mucilaginibacter sp.]
MRKRYLFSAFMAAIFIMAAPTIGQAQTLKNILNTVKNTATQNVNNKAANATNKTIDKIEQAGKTKSKTNTPPPATPSTSNSLPTSTTSGNKANNNSTNEDTSKSYIKIKLSSDKILAGGTVIISGSSVMYESLNSIVLTISGSAATETKKIPLNKDGTYSTMWTSSSAAGSYTITAKSSDGKSQAHASLDAYKFAEMEVITGPGKVATQKAYEKLKNSVDALKPQLTSADAQELKKKMDDVTAKKEIVIKLYNDLDKMGKGIDGIEKKSGPIPPDISANLSKATDLLSNQARQMEIANQMADHQPADNTICEYLVMANEACAAFSTFTNVWAKSLGGVLKNIAIDKVVPAGAGATNGAAGASGDAANIHKECDKVATSAITDAESLTSKLSIGGFAGDLAQMLIDHFLKKYCVVMSGTLSEEYQCTYRNKDKAVWWQYSYITGATVSMRYPKNNQGGNIIKMKGNIEGNATKFTIYQKASEIDEFKEAMKNRAKLYSLQLHAPAAVPFSTSQNDKLGFGAVARAIATPAYFNIPFDADYDLEGKKIKMYLNAPIMDFNRYLVQYIYAYLTFPLGIPLVTRIDFPINSVKLTLGKVIEKNNEFDVKTAGDKVSVDKKGDFKIGDESSSIEHTIKFSVLVKSE